jgi:hypothetical protein
LKVVLRLHSAEHTHVAFQAKDLLLLHFSDLFVLKEIVLKIIEVFLEPAHLLLDPHVFELEAFKVLLLFFEFSHLDLKLSVLDGLKLFLFSSILLYFFIFPSHLFFLKLEF